MYLYSDVICRRTGPAGASLWLLRPIKEASSTHRLGVLIRARCLLPDTFNASRYASAIVALSLGQDPTAQRCFLHVGRGNWMMPIMCDRLCYCLHKLLGCANPRIRPTITSAGQCRYIAWYSLQNETQEIVLGARHGQLRVNVQPY